MTCSRKQLDFDFLGITSIIKMCEVVEISDDEDSSLPDNDTAIKPKDEALDDLPLQNKCSGHVVEHVASTSRISLRSSFIGMGFTPSLVDKAIQENGEANAELLLETLFAYSDLQRPKTELFEDGVFSGDNDGLTTNINVREGLHKSESLDSLDSLFGEDTSKEAHWNRDFPLKEEPDVRSEVSDKKMELLIKMNFSLDEVGFAVDKLGKDASIGQLMDLIFAARMAKKYEKGAKLSICGDGESEKNFRNEALFSIMDKTLRLLEIGFTEQEISAAFEKCGSEVSLQELTDSIFAAQFAGTCPDSDRYSSASLSNSNVQIHYKTLNRGMEGCLNNFQPFDSLTVKTEEYNPDAGSQVVISDLLEKLKGKRPKEEYTDEPNSWKKPKEEFKEYPGNSVGQMWLEPRRGNSSSTSSRVPDLQKRVGHLGSLVEDRKPLISLPNPCKSLTSVVAKPPYFFYGNVTNLSYDSWTKISQFLYSVQPEFVNTEKYSALSRKEGYVHNLPAEDRFNIFPKAPMTIEEAIPRTRKWWPSWDTRKQLSNISCETSGISQLSERLGRMLTESKGQLSAGQQRDLLQQCHALNLVWVGHYKLAQVEPEHLESIMGYPSHHSRTAGISLSERLKSLKLSFQTDTLAYLLSVLRPLFPGGLTVLSFFTGIGGVLVALHRLGIHLKGVVSVDPCETTRRIVRLWWENTGQSGELIQVENSHKLSSSKLEDLIKKFGGFDIVTCQNPYVAADSDDLAGLDFSLFVEFVRVLQRVRTTMERNR